MSEIQDQINKLAYTDHGIQTILFQHSRDKHGCSKENL